MECSRRAVVPRTHRVVDDCTGDKRAKKESCLADDAEEEEKKFFSAESGF